MEEDEHISRIKDHIMLLQHKLENTEDVIVRGALHDKIVNLYFEMYPINSAQVTIKSGENSSLLEQS